MIPSATCLLKRKFSRRGLRAITCRQRLSEAARLMACLAVCVLVALRIWAQDKTLHYTISRNDKEVGRLTVHEAISGSQTKLKLVSDIQTRFVFGIRVKAIEEAILEKGRLIYSSVYQKVNDSEKVNKKLEYVGAGYVISDKGIRDSFQAPLIAYNLICLYTREPAASTEVYSDKYQKFLSVEKTGAHQYKIRFPNGSSNEYFYDKGICTRVRVEQSLYSAWIELRTDADL